MTWTTWREWAKSWVSISVQKMFGEGIFVFILALMVNVWVFCSFIGGAAVKWLHHRLWKVCGQSCWTTDRHETWKVREKMWHITLDEIMLLRNWPLILLSTCSGLGNHGQTVILHFLSKMSSNSQMTWFTSTTSSRKKQYLVIWMLLKEVLMPYYKLQFVVWVGNICLRRINCKFQRTLI